MKQRIFPIIKSAFLSILLGASFWTHSDARDYFITSVIREVPMKSGDPVYKDFYINAGSINGLRKGLFIDAIRKVSAYDNINSKLMGDSAVKIARLRLIHVDKNISIARLVKLHEKQETPLVSFDGVMIGDLIEVSEKQ